MKQGKFALIYAPKGVLDEKELEAVEKKLPSLSRYELRNANRFKAEDVEACDIVFTDDKAIATAYEETPKFSPELAKLDLKRAPAKRKTTRKSTSRKATSNDDDQKIETE